MDSKSGIDEQLQIAPETAATPMAAVRFPAKGPLDLRPPRADATWQASSFDLAQGLDVKVMQSKLSPETLDRLFRS